MDRNYRRVGPEGRAMAEKDQQASAKYIASMCSELATLAERSGFDFGSYLLKIACLEFTSRYGCSETDAPENLAS